VFCLAPFIGISQNNYEINTIVIDAGHGGHDPGCSGKGSKEKHITLKLAKKIGNYVQQAFPEIQVVYTRESDVFVELHERSAIANRHNADLFISVHCNASAHSTKTYGTETYVMGNHKNDDNLNVAKRENASILNETDYANHYDGFDPNSPMAHITFSLYQNAYQDQSIHFADLIEKQFKERAGRKSRGVRQAGFLVLYKTAMPSVLIESGFLTNLNEEKFLLSDYGQDIIASAIYRAFKQYKLEIEQKSNLAFISNDEPILESSPVNTQVVETPITVAPKVEEQPAPKEEEVVIAVRTYGNSPTPPKNIITTVHEKDLTFKVQIFASHNEDRLKNIDFQKIKRIEVEENGSGLKKFVVGNFDKYDEVRAYCNELKESGFSDAFVVRYADGKRIN